MVEPIIPHHVMVRFVTSMVALLNPLADFALFLALTAGRSREEQKQIARQAALAIAVIMISTIWLGGPILTAFGISIGAFSIAGGIVLFGIGLSMLHSKAGTTPKNESNTLNVEKAQTKNSPAVVPLAIPITAGPGVLTALLVNSHANTAGSQGLLAFSIACLLLSVMMGLVFWFAPALGRLLGPSGMQISTQVMGLVVAAIASQMVIDGLRKSFSLLAEQG